MSIEQIISDKKSWNKTIEGFSNNDIYFLFEYFIPFRNNNDGDPLLFFYKCSHGKVAYPFMVRDISVSNDFKKKLGKKKYYDIRSAYGYGGSLYELFENGDMEALKKQFSTSFSKFCRKENIISQFDRFHPIIKNHILFEGLCEVSKNRKTVYMDIGNKEIIWENITSKCRNMIRKAKKNGIRIEIDETGVSLEQFKDIYNKSMDRNKASDYYYFNNSFFNDTFHSLNNKIFIANAFYNKRIIASSLILRHKKYLHYHFSGTLKEYMKLAANNMIIYEAAKWGSDNGYKVFHLGGGYESQGDSLYRFKKSFSKLEDKDFYIGKQIYNNEAYNFLIGISGKEKNADFFPAYRS